MQKMGGGEPERGKFGSPCPSKKFSSFPRFKKELFEGEMKLLLKTSC